MSGADAVLQYAFLGGGGGVIKKYKLPEGEFCHNMIQQQPGIINSLAISPEDVVVSGADDGSLWWASNTLLTSLPLKSSCLCHLAFEEKYKS